MPHFSLVIFPTHNTDLMSESIAHSRLPVAKQFSRVEDASSSLRANPPLFSESAVAALTAASMEALSKRVRSGATWKVFRELDTDGSGEIELNELRSGLQRIGFVMDDQSFDALAQHLDSNGDGRIQYEEFVQKINPKEDFVSEAELMSRSQRHASLPVHLRQSLVAGSDVSGSLSPLTFGGVRSSQNGSNRNSSVGFATAVRTDSLESGAAIPTHEVSAQQQHYAAFRLSSHGVSVRQAYRLCLVSKHDLFHSISPRSHL
jgi:hypothetical protein